MRIVQMALMKKLSGVLREHRAHRFMEDMDRGEDLRIDCLLLGQDE
jgi:hypothetical protein